MHSRGLEDFTFRFQGKMEERSGIRPAQGNSWRIIPEIRDWLTVADYFP